ncbi:MAG: sulfatase-like hydrolase/transferase [Chloroflexi bacterium]|nr:sulfatase-like hydrolase/transferase [Chloroflexota bacterium]
MASRSATPPNVLLLMTDQQRWDTLGYAGCTPCRTPNLDRLAREGVACDRCLTPNPICSPARAALFTGRYAHATGVGNNRELPLEQPTLLEAFRDAGYHIAYSGKWHLGRGRGAVALESWLGERGEGYRRWLQECDHPDTYPYMTPEFSFVVPGDTTTSLHRISTPHTAPQEGLTEWLHDTWVVQRTLEQLECRPKEQPFFHVCSLIGPHPIFVIPEPFYSLYDPSEVPEPPNFADPMTDKPTCQRQSIWHQVAEAHGTTWEPWRRSQAVYWGFVTLLDELLGRVLNRLDVLGLTEDTIVVMLSDHGEMMGGHGLFQKSCMYEESLRVPFLVRAPGRISAGWRLDAPMSLVDVAPTLLRLAGLWEEGKALLQLQGQDRAGWLTGEDRIPPEARGATDDPVAGAVFSEYKPYQGEGMTDVRCIIGPRFKYVWNRDDREELYDTWADPYELHNLASDPATRPVLLTMRRRLTGWSRETGDPLEGIIQGERESRWLS